MLANNVYKPTEPNDWVTMQLLRKSIRRDEQAGETDQAQKTKRKYKNFIRSFLPGETDDEA